MLRRKRVLGAVFTTIQVIILAVVMAASHAGAGAKADGSFDITGTVTDPNGSGVNGASVYATDPNGSASVYGPVTTDSNGYYDLPIALAGSYDIHFVPPSGDELNPVVDSDVMVLGSQTINIQFTPITHTFSGTLTDSNGNPMQDVFVILTSQPGNGDPTAGNRSLTNSSGQFTATAPAGQYYLSIVSESGMVLNTYFTGFGFSQGESSPPIDLTNGNITQNLQLNTSVLHVIVKDANGNTLPNIPVQAYAPNLTTTASLYPNDPGEQITDNAENSTGNTGSAGDVYLDTLPGVTFPANSICATESGAQICSQTAVTMNGSETTVTLSQPIHTFSGTLTDSNGNPMQDVFVILTSQPGNGDPTAGNRSLTNSSGQFTATAPAGQYYLSIVSESGMVLNTYFTGFGFSQGESSPPIDLTNGNITQNLQLNTSVLHVIVKDANGNTLPNIPVQAYAPNLTTTASLYPNDPGEQITDNAENSTGNTGSAGDVYLDTLPGVTFPANSICATESGAQICSQTAVTMNGSETTVTLSQPIHTFSGTLTDSNGNPMQDVFVILTSQPGNGDPTAGNRSLTNSSGQFTATAPAGQYYLSIVSESGMVLNTYFTGFGFSQGESSPPIDLTNGNITQNLQLNTSVLHVIVKDANGNTLPNIPVQAYAPNLTTTASLYPNDPGEQITDNAENSTGNTGSAGDVYLDTLPGVTFPANSICATESGAQICSQTAVTMNGSETTVILQQAQLTPSAPTSLTAPSPTDASPSLSWTSVSSASSYNIYRNGTDIGNTTSTTYTDSSLATNGTQDGTYIYTVTAVNSNGESAQSSPATVVYDTTPPVVTITGAINGETYASNNVPTPICNTTDALSGVATNATLSMFNSGNSYTATCSGASDNAGNVATPVSATYTVLPANYTLVNLTNSTGNYLSNAKVTIENTQSQITTLYTDSFGNAYLNTTPGSYKVTVYYANGYESQEITVTANGPNNVNFSTVPVTVSITGDENSTDLNTATIAQAGNTGTYGAKTPVTVTGTPGQLTGQLTFQVLPGTSTFAAYVDNGYEQQSITATTGSNTVTFNTYSVQVSVINANNNPITTATVDQAGIGGTYGPKEPVNSTTGEYTFYVLPTKNYFEAFNGSSSQEQTLNSVTADTSITFTFD